MAALFRNLFGRSKGAPAPAPAPSVASPPAPASRSAREWLGEGNAALAQGDLAEAEACYRQAVAADAHDALARLNLGFACLETGRAQEARTWLTQALELRRADQDIAHELHFLLARASQMVGDPDAALSHCGAAIASRADFIDAIELEAQLLQQAGRPASALAALDRLLAQAPDRVEALEQRANVLFALGRAQEAAEQFEAVLARKGADPDTLSSLAAALGASGRFEESVRRADEALRLAPGHRDALVNQGRALIELLRVREAEQVSAHGLLHHPADPQLRWNRAVANLLAGRLEHAWPDHEARWDVLKRPVPTVGRPRWDGTQPLRGRTILILVEQGLGDTIQFLRYVPLVAAEAAQVLLELPEPLQPLVTRLPGNCRVVQAREVFDRPDFETPLLSLPLAFRTTLATLPADVPYLEVDATRRAEWAVRLPPRPEGGLRVGLVWSGNPDHRNDHNRSIPLADLQALRQLPHQFVSLQPQVRESDERVLAEWPELKHYGAALRDFADTAAIVSQLDLVISVDTSVAHLAGALGAPTWVLLPHCPDWRWMLDRDHSPWYPSVRLFRQPGPGAWPQVLRQVHEALAGALKPR